MSQECHSDVMYSVIYTVNLLCKFIYSTLCAAHRIQDATWSAEEWPVNERKYGTFMFTKLSLKKP